MQKFMDRFSSAADMFGLKINISKTYPRPSCSISVLQCTLNCKRVLRSVMNHWRHPGNSLTWAAPSQTPALQVWKWKGGSNPPRRPMVRYRRDSGAVMTTAQKPKWRFTQLKSSLACSIPSSVPLFTADTSWLWQDSSFATYAPSWRDHIRWGTTPCSLSQYWGPNNHVTASLGRSICTSDG